MIETGTTYRARKSGNPRPSPRCLNVLAGAALAMMLTLTGCATSVQLGPNAVAGLAPSGTVNMDQIQVAYIGSAGGGTGTLTYQGVA